MHEYTRIHIHMQCAHCRHKSKSYVHVNAHSFRILLKQVVYKNERHLNSATFRVTSLLVPSTKLLTRDNKGILTLDRIRFKEDPISGFREMKLRGLVPNFYIHLSVSEDLSSYFPSFANLYCIAETVVMNS
jgi:hypothetical protein